MRKDFSVHFSLICQQWDIEVEMAWDLGWDVHLILGYRTLHSSAPWSPGLLGQTAALCTHQVG